MGYGYFLECHILISFRVDLTLSSSNNNNNNNNNNYNITGFLVGREKKVKFCGIFRDKFAEKMADFTGISREFSRPVSLKNDW